MFSMYPIICFYIFDCHKFYSQTQIYRSGSKTGISISVWFHVLQTLGPFTPMQPGSRRKKKNHPFWKKFGFVMSSENGSFVQTEGETTELFVKDSTPAIGTDTKYWYLPWCILTKSAPTRQHLQCTSNPLTFPTLWKCTQIPGTGRWSCSLAEARTSSATDRPSEPSVLRT